MANYEVMIDGVDMPEPPLAERVFSIAAGDLVLAQDADIPGVVALMNRAYRGSGASRSWSTEAEYISGDRITESLLRADLAEKPHASLLTWRDSQDAVLKGCVWLEPLGEGT